MERFGKRIKMQDNEIFWTKFKTPLGLIVGMGTNTKLQSLKFAKNTIFEKSISNYKKNKVFIFDKTKEWLDIYFSGKIPDFIPELDLLGTDFQMEVWNLLLKIPYGQTTTYGEIAKQIAIKRGISKMSAQAVGNAVGANPIVIIVPCHRVTGANGNLGGFSCGIDKKIKLLQIEKVDLNQFKI